MTSTISPIEVAWIIFAGGGLPFTLWMAWDVLVDCVDVFAHPQRYAPHRLKAAILNLWFVLFMSAVQISFVAIGLSAMTQPQARGAGFVSPTQAIITIVLFALLLCIVGLSVYWRWMRRLYLRDQEESRQLGELLTVD